MTPFMVNRQKKVHYGQVVPIEDVERIFGFVNSVVRLALYLSSSHSRYRATVLLWSQHGAARRISIWADNTVRLMQATLLDQTQLVLKRYLKRRHLPIFRELEKKGLCHTVWTFITPFIGGICNCDRSDCMAMRATVTMGFPVMFRAEYVAGVNPDLCNGCRQCMRVCQFGAMGYSIAHEKVVIDPRRCYGCGICRASCTKNAIVLNDRSAVPLAASVW